MVRPSGPALAITVLLAVLSSGGAAADTTLDQAPLGPGGIFSDEGLDMGPTMNPPRTSQVVAENFVVGGAATAFRVDEIVIWGTFEPNDEPPPVDELHVIVHADAAGLPGTVLCTEHGAPATRTATGATINFKTEYRVSIGLESPCVLSQGTYWLEVYYDTGSGTDDWAWETGGLDDGHGIAGSAYAIEAPGTVWSAIPQYDLAVQVNGRVGGAICVATTGELLGALTAAAANGMDDSILVVQGTYTVSIVTGPFVYSTLEDNSLELLGGYLPGCADRVLDPTNTILDGAGITGVLSLIPAAGSTGDLHLQGFTIRNGLTSPLEAAGARVGLSAGHSGDVVVDHNVFIDNHAGTGAGGLAAGSDLGVTRVDNNLFAGNTSASGWGAGHLVSSGTGFFVTNNTVADNECSLPCDGGLRLSGATAAVVTNNILWGNQLADLDADTTSAALLEYNDIGALAGAVDPASHDTLNVDPGFAGAGDYHLIEQSPPVDAGTRTPLGGLPDTDLDGLARIAGIGVDLGAYEFHLLFGSGFETGNVREWSAWDPTPPPSSASGPEQP